MPRKRQTLMFSATFSKEIRTLTKEFLHDPVTIEITPEKPAAQLISQRAYRSDAKSKTQLAVQLIKQGDWDQVLVFTRTKHGANRLSSKLTQAGIHAVAIHGNKTQSARTRALEGFKKRKIRVLVATDIAARGLDIVQLPHVINYELPNVPEDYVHRIGRTGRAGMEGEAISLVCNEERPFLRSIEKLIDQTIDITDLKGFSPTIWSDRAPTASEVQKSAAQRKASTRQVRGGPRRNPGPGRPQRSHNNRSTSTLSKSTNPNPVSAAAPKPRNRRNRRRSSSVGLGRR